jgi:hypothetical protein
VTAEHEVTESTRNLESTNSTDFVFSDVSMAKEWTGMSSGRNVNWRRAGAAASARAMMATGTAYGAFLFALAFSFAVVFGLLS